MPFSKGQVANPAGSKDGNAHQAKLAKAFYLRLRKDFEKYGIYAIARARRKDPVQYLNVIAKIMPKQHNVNVQHDYYVLLQQAMEQVQNAEIAPDGRKQLEHLAVNAVEQSIIQGELVEEEQKD